MFGWFKKWREKKREEKEVLKKYWEEKERERLRKEMFKGFAEFQKMVNEKMENGSPNLITARLESSIVSDEDMEAMVKSNDELLKKHFIKKLGEK